MQTSLATERWQVVVLPDINYNTPKALPALADLHSAISQGLTIALTDADFDVLNLHYLGLPNCILEDCSSLTDQNIEQAAKRSGKTVNLGLLYQLNAFTQRRAAAQKWYFSLSGRLLDLQSGTQQDAFAVNNWVNEPAKSCIGDCLSIWLDHNLALLAQDLGVVLSEKLKVLPRRYHYQLTLINFTSSEIQQIDNYLKNTPGYVADTLLQDSQNNNSKLYPKLNPRTKRTYQYISEQTASELSANFEILKQQYPLPFEFEYNNTHRQFRLTSASQTDSWETLVQLVIGLFSSSTHQDSVLTTSKESSGLTTITPPQQPETDEDKLAQKDQQMWQQALSINTQDSYQQYLNVWPQGQHFMQARAAIKEFHHDQNSWQQTVNKNTRDAFQQYLATQPQGKYRDQAKQQLALLRKQQQLKQQQQQHKTLADNYYHQQQNYPEAFYYYKQAAKLGEVSSQYLLGKMYENGQGTKQNMRQAANWYTQAAKQGHSQAQAILGFMYSKGNGVNQDYSAAVNWYQKAAEQGHSHAQYNLAYLYSLGQGVVRNYQQAAFWYQKAAIQGDDDAQNSLGKLYERGLGVNKNLAKAKRLYQQAASQGNQIARLNLKMLTN